MDIAPEDLRALALELGDVLWYVSVLAGELGFDLQEVAKMNLQKLRDRRERGVLQGSGDNR
jgi:NTP pyrophosphatase (non-canonical NTP hydrolase)